MDAFIHPFSSFSSGSPDRGIITKPFVLWTQNENTLEWWTRDHNSFSCRLRVCNRLHTLAFGHPDGSGMRNKRESSSLALTWMENTSQTPWVGNCLLLELVIFLYPFLLPRDVLYKFHLKKENKNVCYIRQNYSSSCLVSTFTSSPCLIRFQQQQNHLHGDGKGILKEKVINHPKASPSSSSSRPCVTFVCCNGSHPVTSSFALTLTLRLINSHSRRKSSKNSE